MYVYYVHIYTYIYIYVYIYIYIFTQYICIFARIYIYVYIYILILSIIRYGSRERGAIQGKDLRSPTSPQSSNYRKRSFRVALDYGR